MIDSGQPDGQSFTFPLNVYACALRLEHGGDFDLHYGIFSGAMTLRQAQEESTKTLLTLLPLPPARLLEVGVGLGTTAARLISLGYTYTGVTPDKDQIHFCDRKSRAKRSQLVNARFEDFSSPTLFDAVVFQESSQYINLRTLFDQCRRLLAPTGKIVILDEFADNVISKLFSALGDWGFKVVSATDVSKLAAPSVSILCEAVERNIVAIESALGVPRAQLDFLVKVLRRREMEYACGTFTYQVLQISRS